MKVKIVDKTAVGTLGEQKDKLVLKDTKITLSKSDMLEVELYNTILAALDNSIIEVKFDTVEEAATIGLRIDAVGRGTIGVGIADKTVHFWARTV